MHGSTTRMIVHLIGIIENKYWDICCLNVTRSQTGNRSWNCKFCSQHMHVKTERERERERERREREREKNAMTF